MIENVDWVTLLGVIGGILHLAERLIVWAVDTYDRFLEAIKNGKGKRATN